MRRPRLPFKSYSSTKSGFTASTVADGGTVTHGLGRTPTVVLVTASSAASANFIAVTAVSSTTFTVAIKTSANAAGTAQKLYWQVS